MAFFSGLKKAYDSLGTEISRTFDSEVEEPDEKGQGEEESRDPEGALWEGAGEGERQVGSDYIHVV